MFDTFELATTVPHEEDCAQVGSDSYSSKARQEVRAFKNQLLRMHGTPPEGAGFKTLFCPHDFGTYLDLALVYDDDDEEHVEWMLKIESGLPDKWDQTAIKELQEVGYFEGESV
jgi:hypothetical protein